ncbi:hypothetical protein [Pantoea agglomerans]|uniref:hypothetical protein n=1 Tax=Enterobacter agglomerans TaxID=549 RepID=UPI0006DD4D2D|nr:hypothetical protein [Pantoea agglomerans]KPA08519.1 putative membrane protein [Pantoea agglomerans]
MQEAYSKGALAIANLLLGKILTTFISSFRKRELYLTYDHVLDANQQAKGQYTTFLKVINKGKDKEKNVEISFPKNRFVKVISTDHLNVTATGNLIKLDRLLPKESTLLNVLVTQGEKLSKNYKPIIRSEDSNGKSYRGLNNIPMGNGPAIFFLLFFVVFLTIISLSLIFRVNPFFYAEEKIYDYKYHNYTEAGYSSDSYFAAELLKYYDIKKSQLPFDLLKIDKEGENIVFNFRFKNNLPYDVYLSSSFVVNEDDGYRKATSKLVRSELKGKEYLDEIQKLDRKYHAIPLGFITSTSTKVAKNSSAIFKVSRPYYSELNSKDFNMVLSIQNEDANFFHQVKFNYEKSKIKSNLIKEN